MTPEPNLDTPEIRTLLNGLAGKKWQGCGLRDLDTADLRHVRRVARTGAVRHEITKLMEKRYWQTRRRLPFERGQNWRPRSEAR